MKKTMDQAQQPSGAKGSVAGVQVASGIEGMLQQLHGILSQLTEPNDHDEDALISQQQLVDLSEQLTVQLQEGDGSMNEPALQVVLQIMDKLTDMLNSGHITFKQDAEAADSA